MISKGSARFIAKDWISRHRSELQTLAQFMGKNWVCVGYDLFTVHYKTISAAAGIQHSTVRNDYYRSARI